MRRDFYKYQGTGNDFVLFDDRSNSLQLTAAQIVSLCDRRFGIGADGVILLRSLPDFDFEMVYYNADGGISSMCGNGGRCIVSFAKSLGIISQSARFLAADGEHEAVFISNDPDIVKLKMKDVSKIENSQNGFLLDTGSPHFVVQVNELVNLDVKQTGAEIRYSARFQKDGVNINFILIDADEINVRTYERGVEDETLSCGTGVTASALVARFAGLLSEDKSPVIVNCPGGKLKVHASKKDLSFSNIWLEGPAVFVFKGETEI